MARAERRARERDEREDDVASPHTGTSLRRPSERGGRAEDRPERDHPDGHVPGQERGLDADERRELAVEAAAHDEEERAEERDRADRAERALRAALDDERSLHEAIGRADELEHLDLGAAALEREAHRRADDREHRGEHDEREQRGGRDAAADEAREALGPRLVGLDVVDRGELSQLADDVGELRRP